VWRALLEVLRWPGLEKIHVKTRPSITHSSALCLRVASPDSTKDGFIGLAPNTGAGDIVLVLLGGQVLYVLRSAAEHFIFVVECYIHGMMDGEAIEMLENGSRPLQTVEIW
jgi:hypothetical protein